MRLITLKIALTALRGTLLGGLVLLGAALCFMGGSLAFAPACAAAGPANYGPQLEKASQKAWREVSTMRDLQTEMPQGRKMAEENRTKEKFSGEAPSGNWNLSRDFFKIVLWVSIGVILFIIILHLRDNLWSSSRSRRLTPEEEEQIAPAATLERMDKAQVEADDLAAQGCFAEAMHVLLLQSVSELRLRLDVTFAASLTSREILQRVGLVPAGRNAFSDIIKRVEISYFGSHQPGREDYQACRQSFEILTQALRQSGRGA